MLSDLVIEWEPSAKVHITCFFSTIGRLTRTVQALMLVSNVG